MFFPSLTTRNTHAGQHTNRSLDCTATRSRRCCPGRSTVIFLTTKRRNYAPDSTRIVGSIQPPPCGYWAKVRMNFLRLPIPIRIVIPVCPGVVNSCAIHLCPCPFVSPTVIYPMMHPGTRSILIGPSLRRPMAGTPRALSSWTFTKRIWNNIVVACMHPGKHI
jgi:hypothetical protein